MQFEVTRVKDKLGRDIVLRNAEQSDAEDLIKYMKITAGETPFLLREPEEFSLSLEQEQKFIQERMNSPRELLLVATIDGQHIGSCSLMSVGAYRRCAHRCEIAIALYKKYCGTGIGRIMLKAALSAAKNAGYEQAELEVACGNTGAIGLYKSLGFKSFGTLPNNMKYADGQYADAQWMMKTL